MIKYEKSYKLRLSDFDCYGRLSPEGVLSIFQDISGEHAERLGVGYDAMLERGFFWVILRAEYRLCRPAEYFSSVRAETVLRRPERATSIRECRLYSESGEIIAEGATQWAVIRSDTRRLAPMAGVFSEIFDGDDEAPSERSGGIKRLEDFETVGEPYIVRPGFSFTDRNGHINNTCYAAMIADAASPAESEVIEGFKIDFMHEIMAGERLSVYTSRENESIRLKALGDGGETKFRANLKLRAPEN